MLDICLLGCGGMVPLPGRWLTALLLRYNGRMLLIDCGEGTQIPLRLAGWGFKSIDTLLLTHYHGDHAAGLPGFLLTLGNSGRENPLSIIGPPSLKTVVGGLTVIAPELPYELNLVEILPEGMETLEFGDMIVHITQADHSLPCLAYSIEIKRAGLFDIKKAKQNNVPVCLWKKLQKGEYAEADGRLYTPGMVLGSPRKGIKVSYLTDSRPTESLAEFVRNSDLLICEGMYGDDRQLQKAIDKKHMLFSEAVSLAKNSNVRELWLTHFSPSLDKPEEYLEKARSVFDPTILGQNVLKKTLNFENTL